MQHSRKYVITFVVTSGSEASHAVPDSAIHEVINRRLADDVIVLYDGSPDETTVEFDTDVRSIETQNATQVVF